MKPSEVDALIARLNGPTTQELNDAEDAARENDARLRRARETLHKDGRELRTIVLKRLTRALRGYVGGKNSKPHGGHVWFDLTDACGYILNHAERPRIVSPYYSLTIHVRVRKPSGFDSYGMDVKLDHFAPKSLAEIDDAANRAAAAVKAWLGPSA